MGVNQSHEGTRTAQAIINLAAALKSGHCPHNLNITFYYAHLTNEDMQILSEALAHPNCPNGLKLEFGDNRYNERGASYIFEGLAKAPQAKTIHLDFQGSVLRTVMPAFESYITSGMCGSGSTFNFPFCSLNSEALCTIVNALEHENAPENLSLNISSSPNIQTYAPLINMLKHGNHKAGLKLKISELNSEETLELVQALENNLKVARLLMSGRCMTAAIAKRIQYLCYRNNLLTQYADLPGFRQYLQQIMPDLLVKEPSSTPLSLRTQTAMRVRLFDKQLPLPEELKDYIKTLQALDQGLAEMKKTFRL